MHVVSLPINAREQKVEPEMDICGRYFIKMTFKALAVINVTFCNKTIFVCARDKTED